MCSLLPTVYTSSSISPITTRPSSTAAIDQSLTTFTLFPSWWRQISMFILNHQRCRCRSNSSDSDATRRIYLALVIYILWWVDSTVGAKFFRQAVPRVPRLVGRVYYSASAVTLWLILLSYGAGVLSALRWCFRMAVGFHMYFEDIYRIFIESAGVGAWYWLKSYFRLRASVICWTTSHRFAHSLRLLSSRCSVLFFKWYMYVCATNQQQLWLELCVIFCESFYSCI